MTRICIESSHLQNIVCSFIAQACTLNEDNTEYIADVSVRGQNDDISLKLASGAYKFTWKDKCFTVVRSQTGPPVSTRNSDREASMLEIVTIESETKDDILDLINEAKTWQKNINQSKIQIYRWCANSEYWRRDIEIQKRSFDTIILDSKTKDKVLNDIKDFSSSETKAWYKKHCIPFKRGYLLYGPPGTGKTSIIHGIGSLLSKDINKINLVAPKLCDDSLHLAVNNVEEGSIIVMEDIDALFGVHREKTETFNVTFSGLLNAIDGVGDTTKGTLFIFTTNHPEKLDPALKRKGRIDMEFNIGTCTREQSKAMFLRFYPEHESEANIFVDNLKHMHNITAAQLQHHFIVHRKSNALDATKIEFESNDHHYASLWV